MGIVATLTSVTVIYSSRFATSCGDICPFTRLFGFLRTELHSIRLLVCTMKGNKILFLGHVGTSNEYVWREKVEDRNCLRIDEEFS